MKNPHFIEGNRVFWKFKYLVTTLKIEIEFMKKLRADKFSYIYGIGNEKTV